MAEEEQNAQDKQEDALRVLVNLAAKKENAIQLCRHGTASKVVRLIESKDEIIAMLACWATNNLSVHGDPSIYQYYRGVEMAQKIINVLNLSARDVLLKGTCVVDNLARDTTLAQQFIVGGVHEALIQVMKDYEGDEIVIEHALNPLINLIALDKKYPLIFAKSGLLHLIISMMDNVTSTSLKEKLLKLIYAFSLSAEPIRKLLGQSNIFKHFSSVLEGNENIKLQSLRTLANLVEFSQEKIVQAGCLLPIISEVSSHDPKIVSVALTLLSNLTTYAPAMIEIRHSGFADPILRLLSSRIDEIDLKRGAWFLCAATQDEWSRKLIIDSGGEDIVRNALANTQHIQDVHTLLLIAKSYIDLGVSDKTLDEMENHYLIVETDSPTNQRVVSMKTAKEIENEVKGREAAGRKPKSADLSGMESENSEAEYISRPRSINKSPIVINRGDSRNDLGRQRTPDSEWKSITPKRPPTQNSLENNFRTVDTIEEDQPLSAKRKDNRGGFEIGRPSPFNNREKRKTFTPADGPMQIRRERIARELMETEESYVKSLLLLNTIMIEPSFKFLSKVEIHSIFGGVGEILSINSAFLGGIKERFKNWNWNTQVADLFLKLAEKLPRYSVFINKCSQAMANFATFLEERPRYKQTIQQQCQLYLPSIQATHCAGHFFIMPVQRIPRYILLLEELKKSTPPQHPDNELLDSAISQIQTIANEINEGKKKAEDGQALSQLHSKLQGFPGTLVKPGRTLLHQGLLMHTTIQKGRYKCIYVYLFLLTDQIIETAQQRRIFQYTGSIPMADLKSVEPVTNEDDEKKDKYPFKLTFNHGGDDYLLTADSDQSRTQWVLVIKRAMHP